MLQRPAGIIVLSVLCLLPWPRGGPARAQESVTRARESVTGVQESVARTRERTDIPGTKPVQITGAPRHWQSQAGEAAAARAYITLAGRGEVYFRFSGQTPLVLAGQLTGMISVDAVREGYVYAYANPREFDEFLGLGIPFEVLTPPSLLRTLKSGKASFDLDAGDSYPTHLEYTDLMHGFAGSYPDLCLLDTIGFSILGRAILAVKISAGVHVPEPEPVFFYTSTMHGDEPAGYVLLLKLIDHLLSSYNKNSLVTRLLDNAVIWINPLANPDGTYFLGNESVYGATRGNFAGTDLNRDFPDPLAGEHPDSMGYQPETSAMMEFMKDCRPDLSANLHGGAEVINYPWDTWTHTHADEDWYILISKDYADTVKAYSEDYFDEFTGGITRGIDWYRIEGGRMDYVNYFLNSREVTMELSSSKIPHESVLPQLWEFNREALLRFMEQALFGISGTVRDRTTGQPVRARIEIPGHDVDNSHIYSDSLDGTWFRYLKEGSYTISVTAQGYSEERLEGVAVYDRQLTRLDVLMTPIAIGRGQPLPGVRDMTVRGSSLFYETGRYGEAQLSVIDLSGRLVAPVIRHCSVPGLNRIDLEGLLPEGVCLLRLTTGGQTITLKHISLR